MSESTATKSNVFKEDLSLATGGTGAAETGTRKTSTGGDVTLTKIDASQIKFRTLAKSLDDLVDGGQDVHVKPSSITMDGTLTNDAMTSAGYLKNNASGVISGGNLIAVADLPTAIPATSIANGSVSNTEFQYLDGVTSNIQTQINAIVTYTDKIAVLQDVKSQGTPGGTFTAGSWQSRAINTEQADVGGIVALVGDSVGFTLAAGTYYFDASCPAYTVTMHQARLYNVSDSAPAITGTSETCSDSTILATTRSLVQGIVTIAGTKTFRLEHWGTVTINTSGFGRAMNVTEEVYSTITIRKLY